MITPITDIRIDDLTKALLSNVESPIEQGMLAMLARYMVMESGSRFCAIIRSPFEWADPHKNIVLASKPQQLAPPFDFETAKGIGISAQVRVGKYRADFALQKLYVKREDFFIGETLLIECDGHKYHNQFDWQVERDEARDRSILERHRCSILRLRGYEIHASAGACAAKALDLLDQMSFFETLVGMRFCGLGNHSDGEAGDGESEMQS